MPSFLWTRELWNLIGGNGLGSCSLQTQLYMHLTNYSVNKHNERFERDETEDKGSKRSIKWFTEFLQENHHDVAKFWSDISVRLSHSMIVTVFS